jgi:hypothetical protein
LGSFWSVPSLFWNFLGIFPCKERAFSLLCVHYPGAPSIFLSVQRMTCGLVQAGLACCTVSWGGITLCYRLLALSHGSCGPRPRKSRGGREWLSWLTRGPSLAPLVLTGVDAVVGGSMGQRESEGRGRDGVVMSASPRQWNRGRVRGSPE